MSDNLNIKFLQNYMASYYEAERPNFATSPVIDDIDIRQVLEAANGDENPYDLSINEIQKYFSFPTPQAKIFQNRIKEIRDNLEMKEIRELNKKNANESKGIIYGLASTIVAGAVTATLISTKVITVIGALAIGYLVYDQTTDSSILEAKQTHR